MHVVVAGAGYTGKRVLAKVEHGIGISRRPRADLSGGLFLGRDLDLEVSGAIALPDSYAMLYTVPPAADGPPDSRLRRLLDSASPTANRIVYISTSGVYGDRHGELTDETVAPSPTTERAKRRLAAERQVVEYAGSSACGAVILRVPGIYGPGRLGLQRLRSAVPVLREEDAGPGNRIHIDDLVACCIAALSVETPAGIYNVGDGNFRSSSWFACKTARLAGLPAPPLISYAEAARTFSTLRLSFMGESRRLDTKKMREVLGVVPRYEDPEEGIRASLAAEGMRDR